MQRINFNHAVVPITFPTTDQTSTVSSTIISLKNYRQADLYLANGVIGAAVAITLQQGALVAAAATSLSFSKYFSTGHLLKYDGASSDTPGAKGTYVTGAAGAVSYIYEDLGGILVCYANTAAFVDNEVLTFSGGKTAVVDGTLYNEDIMVPRTATSDTFTIAAVTNKLYCIPVTSDMLTNGYTAVQIEVASCSTVTHLCAWAILSEPRSMAEIPETALYD